MSLSRDTVMQDRNERENLSILITEKRKLSQKMHEEITLIRAEYEPKIKALQKQINSKVHNRKNSVSKRTSKILKGMKL